VRLVCERRVDGDVERALEIEFVNRRVSCQLLGVPERCPRRLDSLESDSLRLITGRLSFVRPRHVFRYMAAVLAVVHVCGYSRS